ncbi:hypothetical protein RND81_03G004300 [Saponaria officinalis]|uniref:Uncharacterized protein n=1 Tax=Saponaria officinalis TaxID=3572 RepID=A0AAW1M2G0_SAPOF
MKTKVIRKPQLYLFLFIILSLSTLSQSLTQSNIVKTLPGYPGDLPFTLETGYVGVGESEKVQLFYYFIESEGYVESDPLILWLTGGPGCSALSGLFFEIGPIAFNLTSSDAESGTHKLQDNPYSWTKVASIIFLDSPVGTGFSYATTSEAYNTSDTLQSAHTNDFLREWLIKHPKFINSRLYVAGDSYAGMIVPIVVQDILQGNEIGLTPRLNLKGYVLGNPVADVYKSNKAKYKYAHTISLLSDELYKSALISCNGEFLFYVDAMNTKCSKNVEAIKQDISTISEAHVLEHRCLYVSPKPIKKQMSMLAKPEFCRAQHYMFLYSWANDEQVREALHIKEGSIGYWNRCNKSLAYEYTIFNSFDYHLNNSRHSLQVLIYSGDQDISVPYMSTLEWINELNIPISEEWRPWFVDGQVAGYATEFTRLPYRIVHSTIKGGGHTAPEYKPRECLAMLDRWLSLSPL